MYGYINNKNWNDYLLENININYEEAIVVLSLDDKVLEIVCNNFISIKYIGQWDESIIKKIYINEEDEFCKESRMVVKKNNPIRLTGGGIKYIDEKWYHVVVELLDGVEVHIVCTDIKVIERG